MCVFPVVKLNGFTSEGSLSYLTLHGLWKGKKKDWGVDILKAWMQLGKMRVLEKLTVNLRQIGNDILLKISKRNTKKHTKNDIISYSWWSTNLTYWFLAGEIIYRRFLHMLRGMTGVFVLQTVKKIRCWSVGWCKSISNFSINVCYLYFCI